MTLLFLSSVASSQTLPPTLIVSNVTYNAAGQVTQVNFGNGDVTTYTYNDLNLRLTQLKTVKTGGTVVQDLNYTYDAVGNILSITDNVGQADQTFQYDHLNRLTQAVGQNYGTKTYSYDVLGNITQKDGLTYAYDGIAGGPHAVTSLSDGTTFTYDANGNMATQQKGTDLKVFIYDAENRLIEVKLNGTTVESYEYDGDGGRTKKLPNSSTPNSKFIGQMYEEQGTRKTSYIFLGDQRIAAVTNGAILYFHGDHLGSANIVSDSSGTIKELSEYEPYGQFSRHEKYGTPEEQAYFYFTNQYLDETTSLYYYGARYYHPLIGRFITADSIIPSPGYSQAFNRYSYVYNNPLNYVDPDGHFVIAVFAVAALKGALIGATLGGFMAAVTGGNIAQGALFGAIGGAVFAGVGSLAQSFVRLSTISGGVGPMTAGASFAADVLGGVLGGAASGAVGAAYLGNNVVNGAGVGAVSGALFGGISKLPGTGLSGIMRVVLSGTAGGVVSKTAGGTFYDGFLFAASIAGADFIYRAILATKGYTRGASMETAKESGRSKLDSVGNVLKVDGKPTILNDMTVSNVGLPSKEVATGAVNFLAGETGPVMSFLGTRVPGFQGLSLAHDITGNFLATHLGKTLNGFLFNFQTMPLIYGINAIGSVINDSPGLIGFYENFD